MKKIIALDIDGTLYNDEKKITQKTKRLFSKLRKTDTFLYSLPVAQLLV